PSVSADRPGRPWPHRLRPTIPRGSARRARPPGASHDATGGAQLLHAQDDGVVAPFVREAVAELLDAVEARGQMDVLTDLAAPLPVRVIAQMMGVPPEDREHLRALADKLLYINRGESDRLRPLTEGMQGMLEYVEPLVEGRLARPGADFISVLAQ